MTESDWANRPQFSIAQCHAASAALRSTNAVHREIGDRYKIGALYNPSNPEDQRILLDAVFVPDGVREPQSIRGYISSGFCHSSPGDPGTWWCKLGYGLPVVPPLTLFSGIA